MKSLLTALAFAGFLWLGWSAGTTSAPGPSPQLASFARPSFPSDSRVDETGHPWPPETQPDFASWEDGPAVPLSPADLQRNAEAVALADAGDFSRAAAILRELHARHANQPTVRHNLHAVLLAWADATHRAGDLHSAAVLAAEAASLAADANAWILLGTIHRESGDLSGADDAWSHAHRLVPQRADVGLGLANVLAELDRRDRALDVLFRVRDAGGATPDVETMIERLSRELDAEWDFVRVETQHFDLDFDEEVGPDVVDLVAGALDEAYGAVSAKLGVFLDEPARAVLYANEDFHVLTQTPDWTQGVFDGRIKIPLRGLEPGNPALPGVLRHEYAHHVINELARGRCPVWLNEGIAMWAEELADERLFWAEETIAGATVAPLARLRAPFARLNEQRAKLAYAHSYLAVRRLADEYGPQPLVELLQQLGTGRPLDDAFSSVFGFGLSTFERELAAELQQDFAARVQD